MNNHTPGPWRHDPKEGTLRECLTGNYIAQLEQPSTADAKLITAAPMLAEALREAYQISHYGRGSMQDIDDVLERAIRLCGGFSAPKKVQQ